jgi:methionyl aminopeptidase
MAIFLKNRAQIALMRAAGRLVAETLQLLGEHIKPGLTTLELDALAERHVRSHGAIPTFKGYQGSQKGHPPFPGTICASINEVVCHGIPSERKLQEGDLISIDVGVLLDGWCGDSCRSFAVGKIDAGSQKLLDVTRAALERGMRAAGPKRRLGDIGAAIQEYVEANGFSVVREWSGHGIGRQMHEPDPSVAHYGKANTGLLLRPGMVFTIEPMVNMGHYATRELKDGWTVVTVDGARSAQFEHTIAITEEGIEVLSALDE